MESKGPASGGSLSETSREAHDGDHTTRAIGRYLDLLVDALLDEHYLDNELRIEYLLDCSGRGFDREKLANPSRHMASALRRLQRDRRSGELPAAGAPAAAEFLAYAGFGRVRLEHLRGCLEAIQAKSVDGDLVDAGTGRGGAAILMRGFLKAQELPGSRVWVADRFDGRRSPEAAEGRFPPELNTVRDAFARFRLLDERVVFLQGAPSETLADAGIGAIALLRIGMRDPEEVRAVLEATYDRITPGGFVVVDAYGEDDCKAAVDAFRSGRGITTPPSRIDWSGAAWRTTADGEREPATRPRNRRGAAPREPLDPVGQKDLGVVVVVHNMRREAARTLHSLSRSYQEGVEDLDYEVIVVENGSEPGGRLGEEWVRSFGPEFRYIDLGDEASPSPAKAINRGIAASTGATLALMIDGAHVLTPGVVRFAMLGLKSYEPAIVTTKQWYVGPGQQPETVPRGYDERLEDRLFDEIRWPADGYRLFEIGHFIGDRDWFDGEWESNCIFVPRALLEQVGGMDEAFSTPGGGFVNLDFFERVVNAPGVTLVTMLGEGSFHQVHGGTTTNVSDPDELINAYEDQYEELRGRRFQVPPQRAHFVGSLPPPARRTKARRMNSFQHFRKAHDRAMHNSAARPAPLPQDLKTEFIDAFWRSGEWHRTTWLGRWTHRAPTDLLAYQELIWRVEPEWVVETRSGGGGCAAFLASICDLVGKGRVLTIDDYAIDGPQDHPRVTRLDGDPAAPRTAGQAREIVGEPPRALVILGGGSGPQVAAAFRNYSPLVPVGSYVVIEDTVLGGHPVWPEFRPGPVSAAQEVVDGGEFVRDRSLERFGLTFNVGGFLRRVRYGS